MKRIMTNQRVLVVALILNGLSVWAVQCAAADKAKTDKAKTTAKGQSPQKILSQWRAIFPDQPYVCWAKESPWKGLQKLQSPPIGIKKLGRIRLDMGRNEYESTSFVLTNLSDKPMEFGITRRFPPPDKITNTIRKAIWVTLDDGSQVNDALSLIDRNEAVIPSGESLEIWITFRGENSTPGRYRQTFRIVSDGLKSRPVHVNLTVHDISIPKKLPLAVFFSDNIVPMWGLSRELIVALTTDMKNHYVNHAYVHPDPLPRFAVDAKGQLITDYTELDRTIDAYKIIDPKRYVFFWASESFLEPSGEWHRDHPESINRPKYMTPEWKRLFGEWLRNWVAHLKARRIGYDRFIMYPYDEMGGPKVQAMLKLIKEVDPKIQVTFNGALGRSAEVLEKNIAPYVDIWRPYLYHYLDAGGVNGGMTRTVSVKPNTSYTLSFWGKNVGASIYWDLTFDGATPRHASGLDAAQWRKETYSFTTAPDTTQAEIRFFPTIGNKTMLIDDVVLSSKSESNLITDGDMEAEKLSINWGTKSAPLSLIRRIPIWVISAQR